MNTLYHGNNLDVLRRYVEDDTVETSRKMPDALRVFRTLLGETDVTARSAMPAPRAPELKRVRGDEEPLSAL